MWLFLNDAMVSIVAHRTKPGHLMVRARFRGDLERLFPRARVTRTPAADYLFRCTVARSTFAMRMAKAIGDIDYPNFKGSVDHADTKRSAAYMGVWSVMERAQRGLPSVRPGGDLLGDTFELMGGDRGDLEVVDEDERWNR